MNEIKKFSKEWFAINKQEQNSVKSFKADENLKSETIFDEKTFSGTKSQVQANIKSANLAQIVNKFGGVDKLFNLIDSNKDGNISKNELSDIANADTPEFEKEDKNFSTKDLQTIYKNAIDADGAEVKKSGNKEEYRFKDGSKTEIQRDKQGRIVSMKVSSDNDATKGKTVQTEYNDKNNTRTVTTETAGRTVIQKYINDKLTDKTQTLKYDSNSKIDEDTYQMTIGDCWVLAAVNALNDTQAGQDIIAQAIEQNIDGSVTVNLKGVNRSYTYSPEKIGAQQYSNPDKFYSAGDTDMNLIEMAVEDYRKELFSQNLVSEEMEDASLDDPLEGGRPETVISYLTGKNPTQIQDINKKIEILTQKQNNDEDFILLCDFKQDDDKFFGDVKSGHAYSISKVEGNIIHLVNPNDSSYEIQYPIDRFLEYCDYLSYLKL